MTTKSFDISHIWIEEKFRDWISRIWIYRKLDILTETVHALIIAALVARVPSLPLPTLGVRPDVRLAIQPYAAFAG